MSSPLLIDETELTTGKLSPKISQVCMRASADCFPVDPIGVSDLAPNGVVAIEAGEDQRHLVARPAGGDGRMRQFRLDRLSESKLQQNSFARDPDFDIEAHAGRAFGSFHAESEYGEVVWRFRPAAVPVAREFVFHPVQELREEEDGALTVRVSASGHLEMAWHLYQRGDGVEVLKPESLRLWSNTIAERTFRHFPDSPRCRPQSCRSPAEARRPNEHI